MTLALVETQKGLNFTDLNSNGGKRGDNSKILIGLHIDWVEARKEDIKHDLKC